MRRYLVSVFWALFLTCNESLPPRLDPGDVFDARIEAEYRFSSIHNDVLIRFIVHNTYDDVLEDTSTFSGEMNVDIPRISGSLRSFPISALVLSRAPYYEQSSGVLRVPPGDSVVFQMAYDFADNSGRLLPGLFHLLPDTSCPARMISDPETIRVQGSAVLFRRTSAVSAVMVTSLQWKSAWIPAQFCFPTPEDRIADVRSPKDMSVSALTIEHPRNPGRPDGTPSLA